MEAESRCILFGTQGHAGGSSSPELSSPPDSPVDGPLDLHDDKPILDAGNRNDPTTSQGMSDYSTQFNDLELFRTPSWFALCCRLPRFHRDQARRASLLPYLRSVTTGLSGRLSTQMNMRSTG